ncbi:hypothetical protein ACIRLA_36620 [Streptomyces sp. NPDC102364]|uniref:hypothetical protein n=1 Tax=Streptomyces sp. NPDC102364 TaxID=3366161 RepID=UPI00382E0B81
MGTLLAASAVTAVVAIVVVLIMLNHPPLPPARLCALIALALFSSAVAVYCYGWFSVTLGGPFPELCESGNDDGARLMVIKQEYWPLRSACLYSDGSTVEHVSMPINAFVCLLAASALFSTCASVYLRKRNRRSSGVAS